MRHPARSLILFALLAGAPAVAGEFIDTRLSFVFADDNVFAGAGETTPSNANSRFSGFENISNLVLYRELPSFFEGLTTEAALHVLLQERPSGEVVLRDSSSYVNLKFRPPSWGDKENVTLTGFPVSTDRFR